MNNTPVTTSPSFEPQTVNRFIAHVYDQNNNEILPSCVIKSTSRPSFTILPDRKTKVYNNLMLVCYEPIKPNISEVIYNHTDLLLNCIITIETLDPVGNIIETYKITSARLLSVIPDCLDWSNTGDCCITSLSFEVNSVVYTSHIQKSP